MTSTSVPLFVYPSTQQPIASLRHNVSFHQKIILISHPNNVKLYNKCNGNFSGVELLWKPLDNNTYLIGYAHKPLLPSLLYCSYIIPPRSGAAAVLCALRMPTASLIIYYMVPMLETKKRDTIHQTWPLTFQSHLLRFYF